MSSFIRLKPLTSPSFWICLFLLAIPFLYPGYLLFSHPDVAGVDRLLSFLPHHVFVYDNLRSGIIPFWNPHVFGGEPEFGSPEWGLMYPPYLVPLLLFGPENMMDIKLLLHLGIAGVGLFLLLRHFRVGRALATLGALTLIYSGASITKATLVPINEIAAWIPLLIFLNEWFMERPNRKRGLVYAAMGGMMLTLFIPQIVGTLLALVVFLSVARFVKITFARGQGGRLGWWIGFIVLPAVELLVLLLTLRYGGKNSISGFGKEGLMMLAIATVLWVAWLGVRSLRVRMDMRGLWQWAIRFAGIWTLALCLAAPQLGSTFEMVRQSNQARLKWDRANFFTGKQAYGNIQNFAVITALAKPKETVNNMAVGPVVYLLIGAGIAAGLHRRRRIFLLTLIATMLIGCVYFTVPGIFDFFLYIPFFRTFAGLARYLSFLSVLVILLAILSAQMLPRLLPYKGLRLVGRGLIFLVLSANLALLITHDHKYMSGVVETKLYQIPESVTQMLRKNLPFDARFLIDGRREENYPTIFTYSMKARQPGIPGYNPIRVAGYDDFVNAHNASFGLNYNDYHRIFPEPAPSPWTKALGVQGFLFPPGAMPPRPEGLNLLDEAEGFRLYAPRETIPAAWPETDLNRNPPTPQIPAGWKAKRIADDASVPDGKRAMSLQFEVMNPGEACWMVIPQAWYPGWQATIDSRPAPVEKAYGYLCATSIPSGPSAVEFTYRLRGFLLGWHVFLWGVWMWLAMAMLGRNARLSFRIAVQAGILGIAIVGLVALWFAWIDIPVYLVGKFLFDLGILVILAIPGVWVLRRMCRCRVS